VLLRGDAVTNGYHFAFYTGFDGHALLATPIPRTAAAGLVQVQATATCGQGVQTSAQAAFTVGAANLIPFAGHLFLTSHRLLLRSPSLPPHAGAVVHDTVAVITNANDLVTVVATLFSTNGTSLGTDADGGTMHQSGDILYIEEGSADSTGQATFSVPLTSDILTPGRGAVIRVTVTSAGSAGAIVYRTSVPIREQRLRLVVQPKESTRGGRRPVFVIGHQAFGSSVLSVLVLADGAAHLSASATFGALVLTAIAQAGPGGRATMKFKVPNSVSPRGSVSARATVAVSSMFRGASESRSVTISYGRL
jgi:hypothetical protein